MIEKNVLPVFHLLVKRRLPTPLNLPSTLFDY